ncbi:hypothetical protein CRYO30217_00544 [Parvicella tangerina]|uniref:Uncharacterized protein n=2 Tax=Parvicella tangerina TaxID=2829795 RepID=A0A916JK83_9FLAO|nr:hypothetical protein CRYO30217_00544 [Parvicella tangerina]
MNYSADIKNDLIRRIQEIDDLNFLTAIQTILKSSENKLFAITKDQEEAIEMSRKEIAEGIGIESDVAIAEIRLWLQER